MVRMLEDSLVRLRGPMTLNLYLKGASVAQAADKAGPQPRAVD